MVQVHVADTKDNVGALSGAFVAEASAKAIAKHGRFVVAISGGSLPKLLALKKMEVESLNNKLQLHR